MYARLQDEGYDQQQQQHQQQHYPLAGQQQPLQGQQDPHYYPPPYDAQIHQQQQQQHQQYQQQQYVSVPSAPYTVHGDAGYQYQPATYPLAPSVAPYPSLVYQPVLSQAQLLPAGQAGHLRPGLWSDSIWDCFDSGLICLLTFCLPSIRFALTISRLRLLSFPAALLLHLTPYLTYTVLYCYLNIAFPSTYGTDQTVTYNAGAVAVLVVMLVAHVAIVLIGGWGRGKVRKASGIDGAVVEDVCWHCWCGCCALAQEARHVDRDLGLPV